MGEQVVRSIFPETTIVRPAPIFGFEDNLLLRLAGITNLFTANNMQERYWPVHVSRTRTGVPFCGELQLVADVVYLQSIDLGRALELMLYDDNTAGQTFELYGPKNYSTAEIKELVDREIFKSRPHINLPKWFLKPAAGLANRLLWWPMLSAQDVEREFIDQKIDKNAKTFKDLGIEPGDISNFTYHYLVRNMSLGEAHSAAADSPAARIPQLIILRSSAGHGEGEEGGEEVSACGR